jgi:hypothetical protein
LNPYTQSQLKDAQLELEAKRDWLAARGIKYLFVIAPEKASIYPEHLPASLKPATTTRTDQLVEYLRLHSMVAVLDLRPALRRARQKFPVYYKTDPHWNLPGAFVACQTILSHLSSQFPGLVPFDGDAFSIQWRPGTGGCEASLADEPYLAEANRFVFLPGPALPELEFRTPDNHPLGLQQIWGLPSLETGFTTTNSRRSRRVEVFGDSFASYLQPFLGFHFGTTIYHYRTRFDKVSVNKAQPDLVIEETVERYLWGR